MVISTGFKIGYGAFANNSTVENIVISSSINRVYNSAFRNCSSLKTVIIPTSVTSIGADAFDGELERRIRGVFRRGTGRRKAKAFGAVTGKGRGQGCVEL